MTGKEKKELILRKIANGDKRSYNEIAADLELEQWTLRYKTPQWVEEELKKPKKE